MCSLNQGKCYLMFSCVMSVDGLFVFSNIFTQRALVVVDCSQITLNSLSVMLHCQMVLSFSRFVLGFGFKATYFTGTPSRPELRVFKLSYYKGELCTSANNRGDVYCHHMIRIFQVLKSLKMSQPFQI